MKRTLATITVWTCGLFLLAVTAAYPQGTLSQILNNGPTSERINFVFLAEGYTAAQQSQFNTDAVGLMNYLLGISPFADYNTYYNVFTIFVASNESGSDHPWSLIYKDTYFSSTYDSYGLQRLITIPPNDWDGNWANGEGKLLSLLSSLLPSYDIAILIVNDLEYGGSGGAYAITSVHPAAPDVVVHELGHTMGYLGDEYDTPWVGAPTSEEPNTTQETQRELIKWNAWILPTTPIPTPETQTYASVVGLFEGAHYHATDWYRPKLNCMMKALAYPFCEVCKEQLVRTTYEQLSPIVSHSPGVSTVPLAAGQSQPLSVDIMQPPYHSLDIQWYLNSSPIPGATSDTYMAVADDLGDGSHNITVEVSDNTPMVLTDPYNLLFDTRSWTVEVSGAGCCTGIRGNANGDLEDKVNVSDVSYLVAYLFGIPTGPEPPCQEEGNTNGDLDEKINVSDVSYLVTYLFGIPSGPAPGACPETATPTGTIISHSGCKSTAKNAPASAAESDQDCLFWTYDGAGTLQMLHLNAGLNCCPVVVADIFVVGSTIIIEEIDSLDNGGCECLCLYDIGYEIIDLPPGEYTIQVIEPYLPPGDEPLEVTVDLLGMPTGSDCVIRTDYPWLVP
ncbi:MAG: M64 family metallopeptidase [candidate division Zixibacteria bacterium]|nr:M64 family metallopeptidase [candidate division Zixibacteria bacterium]